MAERMGKERTGKFTLWVLAGFLLLVSVVAILRYAPNITGNITGNAVDSSVDNAPSKDFMSGLARLNAIDATHNISFDDYSKGLEYLRVHPRYPNPLNSKEISQIQSEYNAVDGGAAFTIYRDFRISLFDTERDFRVPYFDDRAYFKRGIRCSYRDIFFAAMKYVNLTNDDWSNAKALADKLLLKYPKEAAAGGLTPEFVKLLDNDVVDFVAKWAYNNDEFTKIYNAHCLNYTQPQERSIVLENYELNQ